MASQSSSFTVQIATAAVTANLAWKDSVRAATTAALSAATYANGTAGEGATLTAVANGALPAQDGVSLAASDRLLVKNQAAGLQNGVYTVSQVGTAGSPFVLTRATDADVAADQKSAAVLVEEGATQADQQWTMTTDNPTIGVTTLTWIRLGGLAQVTAGAGLTKTGDTLDVGAGVGIVVNADDVAIDFGEVGDIAAAATANSAGVLDEAARADHAHDTPAPTPLNKFMAPATTSGDNSTTALTISATPALDSMVVVTVDGIEVELGDGVKTKNCYFSADGGATARAISAITGGDTLYWNGAVSGYDLDATDRLSFHYLV